MSRPGISPGIYRPGSGAGLCRPGAEPAGAPGAVAAGCADHAAPANPCNTEGIRPADGWCGPAASSPCASARKRAKGVVFVTLEDETGHVNVIVWKAVRENFAKCFYQARLLAVHGVWQRDDDSGGRCATIAHHLVDLTHLLGTLTTSSRDFR